MLLFGTKYKTELVDLLDQAAFQFFHILNISYEWIHQQPADWRRNENYNKAAEFVRTVKVVNDSAERGIKFISDYANILTKDHEIRRQMLSTFFRQENLEEEPN